MFALWASTVLALNESFSAISCESKPLADHLEHFELAIAQQASWLAA